MQGFEPRTAQFLSLAEQVWFPGPCFEPATFSMLLSSDTVIFWGSQLQRDINQASETRLKPVMPVILDLGLPGLRNQEPSSFAPMTCVMHPGYSYRSPAGPCRALPGRRLELAFPMDPPLGCPERNHTLRKETTEGRMETVLRRVLEHSKRGIQRNEG